MIITWPIWEWHRPYGSKVRYLIDTKGNTIVHEKVTELLSEENANLLRDAPALLALARYAVKRGEGDSDMAREILGRLECICDYVTHAPCNWCKKQGTP